MKGTLSFVAAGVALLVLVSAASAYVKHRRHAAGSHTQTAQSSTESWGWGSDTASRPRHAERHASHRLRRQAHETASPFGCLPAPLRAKVVEIVDACGTHVLRTFTPGAVIAGTRHLSEHAFCLCRRSRRQSGMHLCAPARLPWRRLDRLRPHAARPRVVASGRLGARRALCARRRRSRHGYRCGARLRLRSLTHNGDK